MHIINVCAMYTCTFFILSDRENSECNSRLSVLRIFFKLKCEKNINTSTK